MKPTDLLELLIEQYDPHEGLSIARDVAAEIRKNKRYGDELAALVYGRAQKERLCPKCLGDLDEGAPSREYRGDYAGAPAYETMRGNFYCANCGWEEDAA